VLVGAVVLWPKAKSIWPALGPAAPLPSVTVSGSVQPGTSGPLQTAPGWSSALLTNKVKGARDIVVDPFGNIWVSQTSEGLVSMIELKPGEAPRVNVMLRGLRKPHGLVFDPEFPTMLYIAEEHKVSRLPTYSDGRLEKIADLPVGGRHFSRTLAFGSDDRLYVGIGSTCDVCIEKNAEIATVISMERDGSKRATVATGLRNPVFLANRPGTKELWTTEMGRDNLGDDLPPDELNIVEEGKNYGWPICYGNRVHDTDFDKNQYFRDPCADTEPPVIEIPAHSAPLGLAFMSRDDLLVAYHGSWNRTEPTGYKVVRWQRSGKEWKSSDFLTGFLKGNSAIGRPVDIAVSGNTIYVSDDKAGAVWVLNQTR
jgi:glucose/arabinose dehydrogenase